MRRQVSIRRPNDANERVCQPGLPDRRRVGQLRPRLRDDDLPAYVALPDPVGLPWTGKAAWSNGFLPAAYQGVMLNPSATDPVPDLFPARSRFVTPESERDGRATLDALNRRQAEKCAGRFSDRSAHCFL